MRKATEDGVLIPNLFAAAYLVPKHRHPPRQPSRVATAFYSACGTSLFPYDVGDDPAFFAAEQLVGPVTWGVCRPDVRGMIQPGDWCVFFSAQHPKANPANTEYRFVAALEVEFKMSHTEIWNSSRLPNLKKYLNLLVRPSGSGWEHHEPATHRARGHEDWMWRLCRRRGLTKEVVTAAASAHVTGAPLKIGGQALPIEDNYVVFSKSSGWIVAQPLLVAVHERGDSTERWLTDRVATRIRQLVFDGSRRKGLRTANPQQPHRHFRRPLSDASTWAEELRRITTA